MAAASSDLQQKFDQLIEPWRRQKIHIAFSGGLDSSVLLYLLVHSGCLSRQQLAAIHVNHSLSEQADDWQDFCVQQCRHYGVKLHTEKITLHPVAEKGLEAQARIQRYQALFRHTAKGDILCTAHHLDDQIETFFLRLLRGSGIKGLAAISPCSKRNGIILLRPLLAITRQELHDFASQRQIAFINDPGNQSLQFDRNYIRHQIIPLVRQRYPGWQKTISRSISHIQAAQHYLQNSAKKLYKKAAINKKQLDLQVFNKFSAEQQIALLRYWFDKNHIPQPGTKKLDDLMHQLHHAEHLAIQIKPVWVKKYRQRLFLIQQDTRQQPQQAIIWNICEQKKIKIPSVHRTLARKKLKKLGIDRQQTPVVEVRFRKGGEKVTIKGVGQQSLKKFMQKKNIPPWERDFIPLIYIDGKLDKVYIY